MTTPPPPHNIRPQVLVAEDHAINQRVITVMLRRLGYDVTIVGDGRQCVDAALAGSYDIVLMDIQMPRMDGLDATREIRVHQAEGRIKPMPIIGVTAHAMVGDRTRGIEAGLDDYVPKPLEMAVLERVLERHLR